MSDADLGISEREMSFLTGGQSMKGRTAPIKIGARVFTEASELVSAIKRSFTEDECREVLRQLQSTGMLTAQEVGMAQQKASAFTSTVTMPTVQRAAIIAVGMAVQKGTLSPIKLATLAKLANDLDLAGNFLLADKIDDLLFDIE
jgi:hypothetical protein